MKVKKVWGNFIDEKDYQHYFVDRLVKDNGFVRRENKHIDQATAMDVGMLIEFLEDTQPKAMAALAKTYGAKRDAIIAAKVNQLLTQKAGGGLLAAFKHEVTIGTTKLKLLYRPQETRKNKAASELAAKNVFSVAEEVWSKAKEERGDVVVFGARVFPDEANTPWYDMVLSPEDALFEFGLWQFVQGLPPIELSK